MLEYRHVRRRGDTRLLGNGAKLTLRALVVVLVATVAAVDAGASAAQAAVQLRAQPGSPVTAVKRDNHQEDIFVIGTDGAVWTKYVTDHNPWSGWISLGGSFPPGSAVTAIKRDNHQEDIFAIRGDGSVWTSYVVDHGPWSGWIPLGGGTPHGTHVTAVKRDDHQEDIFVIGTDGGVWTDYVVDHGPWSGWIPLGGRVPPGSNVTGIKRDGHQEDIFVIGTDGGVWTDYVVDHGPWSGWGRIADWRFFDGFTVPSTASFATFTGGTSWGATLEELLTVGRDGVVYNNQVQDHGPWQGWYGLTDSRFPDGFRVNAGSPVSAAETAFTDGDTEAYSADLFVTGFSGAVFSANINNIGIVGGYSGWSAITDPAFFDGFTIPAGSPITPIVRDAGQEDVFVTGRDGVVYTNWSTTVGAWNRWLPLAS